MKILYVQGESDFSAMGFENEYITNKDKVPIYVPDKEEPVAFSRNGEGVHTFAKLVEDGTRVFRLVEDGCEEELEMRVLTFGEVDPMFILFMRDNFINYDESKYHNFYVLED